MAKGDGDFKTIVNFIPEGNLDWGDRLDTWCREAGDYIDIIGLDHYPGTWALSYDWSPLAVLITKINDPNDPCYGKEASIMETGCPGTFEAQQAYFAATSLLTLRALCGEIERTGGELPSMVCWYELYDENSSRWWDREARFGVIESDKKTLKAAYHKLKLHISQFG